ncbi:RBBP9/YdeN family alpha/beta hydrolase [Rhizobium rhizosphaerae]|nr:alpha/beta hydrolase [Xaviernesmea rhizosphaerae]
MSLSAMSPSATPLCPLSSETLILPGLFGSAPEHWQRQWARDRPASRVVEQADWDHPQRDAWLSRLEGAIAAAGEVWLVAHSLGCLLAAALAERPLAAKVSGALLVAPCDLAVAEERHPGAIDFGAMPARALPFPSLVVGSLDDPYMSADRLQETADGWGSGLVVLGKAGHINIDSGYGRWPGGYALLDRLRGAQTQNQARRHLPPRANIASWSAAAPLGRD